jgi:hypothetical protein
VSYSAAPALFKLTTPRVAYRVSRTKVFSSTLKNALAYYNAGVLVENQVNQIGRILPNWRLFTYWNRNRSSPHFCAILFLSLDYVLILAKMGCDTFWAILSQTHLVTLLKIPKS